MAKLRTLTADSVELLQEMLDAQRRTTVRPGARVPNDDHQAPEIYVAKTLADIAPMTGVAPPWAECTIYQAVPVGTGLGLETAGFDQPVYNVSPAGLAAGRYFLAARDKFGTWFVAGVGAAPSAPCADITVSETDLRCEDGLLKWYRRDVAINIEPATGCLTLETGEWDYVKSVGCCDDTCTGTGTDIFRDWWCIDTAGTATSTASTPTGTGTIFARWWCVDVAGTATATASTPTGTGTGSPQFGYWCLSKAGTATATLVPPGTGTGTLDPSPCGVCATIPSQYRVTLAGFTDDTCTDCEVINGTWTLTYVGTAGGNCYWAAEMSGSPCPPDTLRRWISLVTFVDGVDPQAVLQIGCTGDFCTDGGLMAYQTNFGGGDPLWNCTGSSVLGLGSVTSCNAPATITVTPV